MLISSRGILLIKTFEGLKLAPYKDAVGRWTVGFGHTQCAEELALVGLTITPEQACHLLDYDLHSVEDGITKLAPSVNQNQFDALCSFALNLGVEALAHSTLLRELRLGHIEAAAGEFGKWVHAGDKVLAGLVKRREAEKQIFLRGSWDAAQLVS
jgi:lysozyme